MGTVGFVLLLAIVVGVFAFIYMAKVSAVHAFRARLDRDVSAWSARQGRLLSSDGGRVAANHITTSITPSHEKQEQLGALKTSGFAVYEQQFEVGGVPEFWRVTHKPTTKMSHTDLPSGDGWVMRPGDTITLAIGSRRVDLPLWRFLSVLSGEASMQVWDDASQMYSAFFPAKLDWHERRASIYWLVKQTGSESRWRSTLSHVREFFSEVASAFEDDVTLVKRLSVLGFGGGQEQEEVDTIFTGFLVQAARVRLESDEALSWLLERAVEEDLMGVLLGAPFEEIEDALRGHREQLPMLLAQSAEVMIEARMRQVDPSILEANIPDLIRLIAKLYEPTEAIDLARQLPDSIHRVVAGWGPDACRELLTEHAAELSRYAAPKAQEGLYRIAALDAGGDYSALLLSMRGAASVAVSREFARVVANMAKHHPEKLADLEVGHTILRAMRSAARGDAYKMQAILAEHGSPQIVGRIEELRAAHGDRLANAALFEQLQLLLVERTEDASIGGLTVVGGITGGLTMSRGEAGALEQLSSRTQEE